MRGVVLAVTILGATALSGCVSTSVARFDDLNPRIATAANSIIIYRSPDEVPGQFREIGLIEANGDLVGVSTRRFYAAMRRRAAEMGATGIILDRGLNPGQTGRFVASLLDIQAERFVHGTAIIEQDREAVPVPLNPAAAAPSP
jgi:hypothetical protein